MNKQEELTDIYCDCEVTLIKTFGRTVNEKPSLIRIMIYCNSAKQAFHIFAIAKVFNNIKIDRKLQVPISVGSSLTVIPKQIPIIQSGC